MRPFLGVLALLVVHADRPIAHAADDPRSSLTVLDGKISVLEGKVGDMPTNLMMHHSLLSTATTLLGKHRHEMLARTSPADIQKWQAQMRAWLIAAIGGLPPGDTPLHAQVTGRIQKRGYRVEKILLQSQPGLHVTAALFLPDAPSHQPPYPAVLVACGHSPNGKALDAYQRGAALMAVNGIAALMFDPIDQGERPQLRDRQGRSVAVGTSGHNLLGIGAMLLGHNTSRFMVHDARRCLDYLESRGDIDANRLGMAGNSGGGTQTALVMSIDERLKAAAPSCYITDFAHLLPLVGPHGGVPGDAEQNVAGQLTVGLDHWGFLLSRAPMPTLVCAAQRDFFPIDGTRASVDLARDVFKRLGSEDRIQLTVAPGEHGWQKPLREATATWMLRWLSGEHREVKEPVDLQVLSDQEIQVTSTGQVLDLNGARSVYDLQRDALRRLRDERNALWKQRTQEESLDAVRRVTTIRRASELRHAPPRFVGRIVRDGYRIDKLVIEPEPDIALPVLAFIPSRKVEGVVLWLDENGKTNEQALMGIEQRVSAGSAVFAVDVRGLGETRGIGRTWYGIDDAHMVIAYMIGRSYTAMRAEDILAAAKTAREVIGADVRVELVAHGAQAAVPALHAAALERELFGKVSLKGDPESLEPIVTDPRTAPRQLVHVIHAALTVYDLPDLRAVVFQR